MGLDMRTETPDLRTGIQPTILSLDPTALAGGQLQRLSQPFAAWSEGRKHCSRWPELLREKIEETVFQFARVCPFFRSAFGLNYGKQASRPAIAAD
jgi:hypothetical protein